MRNFIRTLGLIALVAVIGLSMAACGGDPGGFIAVTDITGVPTAATVEIPFTLTGTVVPTDATNKTIVWSVISGSVTVNENTLTAAVAGTVTVRATIANGTAQGKNYTKDFPITVSGAGDPDGPVDPDDPVDPVDPALTGSVTISPFVKVGVNVTVNVSALGGSGTISYSWMTADTVDGNYTANGTTVASYTPVTTDEDSYLKVEVTRAGYSGSVFSNAVKVQGTSAVAPTVSSVVVSPDTASKDRGTTQQFSAIVSGSGLEADPSYDDVIWSVSSQNPGTSINTTGLLTIAATETATTLTVTAMSILDATQSGTATVTVTIPTGTISVKITGIPVNVMQSAVNYNGFEYRLYHGNELNLDHPQNNILAGWDSGMSVGSTDYTNQTSGTVYYQFTFVDTSSDDNYTGIAGGYDIGIWDKFSGATWSLKNRQLNITTVNEIPYSAFTAVVGTFRIRITGLPVAVMTAAEVSSGFFLANALAPSTLSMSNFPQSLDNGGAPDWASPPYVFDSNYTGQNSGTCWVEFSIWYNNNLDTNKPYVGPAGNYDFGLFWALNANPTLPEHWGGRAISNHRFEVNTVNTIDYSQLEPKTPTP